MSMERRLRFELLYGKYAPAVKAYVLRRTQSPAADDLVVEVFLVCWRRMNEVPLEPLPWLLGIARRVLSTSTTASRGAPPGLGSSDRELLRLIAWERLSPRQAAVILGVSSSRTRAHLLFARRRFPAGADALTRLSAANPVPELPPAESPERLRCLIEAEAISDEAAGRST